MLAANKERLDYGKELAPPEGFELDAAVASTYSLDLNALLAVPIALCFNNTLEGDLKGEKIALLEAMSQLKGKLKVFYQKGNVHYPSSYNRLFALLEPCLCAVVPSGGEFSSFHPKVWLLRFIESDKDIKRPEVKYRLLILSRNLTFDRSWDIALTLDGKRNKIDATQHQPSWIEFFKDLLGRVEGFDAGNRLLKDLPHICWEVPKPFKQLELCAGGPSYGRPVDHAPPSLSQLMVVSPFIKSQGGGVAGLQYLAGNHTDIKKVLCGRGEELNAIGEDTLRGWDCYSMNQAIVDGEEFLGLNEGDSDVVKSQNLHAKIVIRQTGKNYDWIIGSANATSAALGDNNSSPRNTEVVAKLSGQKVELAPELLLETWLEQGLFVPHNFELVEVDSNEKLTPVLRRLKHQLVKAEWVLNASINHEEGYDLVLSHNFSLDDIPSNASIVISPLAIFDQLDITDELKWAKAPLSKLSSFIVIDIEVVSGERRKAGKCVISADLSIEGGDHRQSQLLQSLVGKNNILNYVRLLLDIKPDKAQWMDLEQTEGNDQAAFETMLSSKSPLFEMLMVASSRHPEVIERINKLIKRLKEAGIEIPSEFNKLWRHFAKELP